MAASGNCKNPVVSIETYSKLIKWKQLMTCKRKCIHVVWKTTRKAGEETVCQDVTKGGVDFSFTPGDKWCLSAKHNLQVIETV